MNTITWSDEIYLEIPMVAGQEKDAWAQVQVGKLGYRPVDHAFCIFFGPTPAGADERPRAYSPVNTQSMGRVLGDASRFCAVRDGASAHITRLEKAQ